MPKDNIARGAINTVDVGTMIPAAQAHTVSELRETFARLNCGINETQLVALEGASISRKLSYIADMVWAKRKQSARYIQLWPALGLLEPALFRTWQARVGIIIHDPVPLRRQFGYGAFSKLFARHYRDAKVDIISLTTDATYELQRLLPGFRIVELAHPIRSVQTTSEKTAGTVLVAGQYKPARDLDLLAAIGLQLRAHGLTPQIIGRGWPTNIPGWEVRSDFVSDNELAANIARASVILLPYRHFFQSGIMVQGLELNTPTVAPDTSFSRQVLGDGSPLVIAQHATPAQWVTALLHASSGAVNTAQLFNDYQSRCDAAWGAYINTLIAA
ncbi:MAG: hypothetical protein LBJ43_03700 [Propionibacteriaceae bacterium]|jgi:hypothetical protein|nr:hypothetical protein [Propionibacteriaceae bacterium]